MASPQGGFGSRHHDRRETAIDHARAVERIVRGIMLHPFVGHHLFPALGAGFLVGPFDPAVDDRFAIFLVRGARSEEHTSELQSLMRISYAVFCLKTKKRKTTIQPKTTVSE